MIQAAIVEDEKEARSYIRDKLAEEFKKSGKSVSFDLFSDGQEFLSMFEKNYHYDILFFDIEMPGLNGFDLCRKVRELKPDALVVFISGREELVFQSFEVQPFRFIRKGNFSQQLPSLAVSVIKELDNRKAKMISVIEPVSHDVFSFDVRMIKYVEASNKECVIASTNGLTSVKCKFMQLEELLKEESFLKIHRSYLVNCRYIFYIGKNSVLLTTKEELPISRGHADEIRTAYLRYLAD